MLVGTQTLIFLVQKGHHTLMLVTSSGGDLHLNVFSVKRPPCLATTGDGEPTPKCLMQKGCHSRMLVAGSDRNPCLNVLSAEGMSTTNNQHLCMVFFCT